MECLAVFFVLMVLLGVMMTLASQSHVNSDRWRRAFHGLAKRYGGHYLSGGWFGRPSVRFRHGGTAVIVDMAIAGSPKRAQLTIQMHYPDAELRCEAYPRRIEDRHLFRGMYDEATGAEAFDREYVVRSDQGRSARPFFSDGVQLQLNRIRYLLGNDNVYVAVQRGRLLVKKEFPRHGGVEHVDEVVALALELYDQAMLTRSHGIEFVQHQSLQTIDQCVCMVCGDELNDDVVLCRRCKTPHHHECWVYYGSCSTYGCRETEFVVPRIAQPLVEPPPSEESASFE